LECSDGPWFPTINSDECDGCAKTGKPRCIEFCPNNVFTFKDGKAEVTNPASCGVGSGTFHCSACAPLCPKNASFSIQLFFMLHFTKEKATKTCFEKQNAKSAGKHIGQTVTEIFALTV
jgi:NAD-dependent dihydropyrimidine dehydrogenase PreA subunit